jgi:hypothetical protein
MRTFARMRASRVTGITLCAGLIGCAQYQYVNVQSQPEGAEVFLDKQRVGVTPLELRIDRTRAHAVYVKREGYRPELVVLEMQRAPGGLPFLTPPDVELRLVPGEANPDQERDLEIEVDPGTP